MEDPTSTNDNIPVSSGADTTVPKPQIEDIAEAAAQRLDNRIAGQREDFNGTPDKEVKERARRTSDSSVGSHRKPLTFGSKDFRKTRSEALFNQSSSRRLTKMPASLGSQKRSSGKAISSPSSEKESTDLKKPPAVTRRSSRSDNGLSASDAEAKARARSSFYSSSSVRLDLSQLQAKSKNKINTGEESSATNALSANRDPRKPRLAAASGSSRNLLEKNPPGTKEAFATTSIRRLMRSSSKRSINSSKNLPTNGSSSNVTTSGMTNIRDMDPEELIAYKTGIPLDQEESEPRPVAVLGPKRAVGAHNVGQNGSSNLLRGGRQSASSASRKRITSSMDLDERIAYKTGIPLDSEDKQGSTDADSSSDSIDGGDVLAQKSHGSRKDGTRDLVHNEPQYSAASRSGITNSRDIDQLIAYKTGIPLDDKAEESSVPGAAHSNLSKKADVPADVEKRETMKENKLGYKPNLDGGRAKGGDIEDLGDMGDLAVATEIIEEETEDAFIPSAIKYDAEAKPPIYKNRRFRLYSALTSSLLVVVIVVVVGMIASKKAEDKHQANVPDPTEEKDLSIMAQLELVVGSEQLNDPESSHYRAMMWLLNDDLMQVGTKDVHLVQRFLLASFYIQSHDHGEWLSCNAPNTTVTEDTEDTEDTCFFQQLVNVYPQKFRSVPSYRWLSAEHECQWAGLECDESDYVRTIDLLSQNIGGSLPVEFTHLRFLQGIRLNWNELTGTIPEEYGVMNHLVHLELHFNSLTGSIPGRWSEARNLQSMNVAENFLTGTIPTGFGEMVNLKGLFLFGNVLTGGLPESLGDMAMLKYIRLHKNRMSGSVPSEIGRLFPEEIWLHKQPISGVIPSELGKLGNIKVLRLSSTSLHGTIPEELYNLSKLSRLDLANSDLSGTLSTRVGQMESLSELNINDNSLSGDIPNALGKISDLSTLWVHGNKFSGDVPMPLCDMKGPDGLEQLIADCLPSNSTGVAQNPCFCCDTCCDVESGVCRNQDE